MPNDLVKSLAFELKKAEAIEDIQSILNIYLHDPVTGLARGAARAINMSSSNTDRGRRRRQSIANSRLVYNSCSYIQPSSSTTGVSPARPKQRRRPKRFKRR